MHPGIDPTAYDETVVSVRQQDFPISQLTSFMPNESLRGIKGLARPRHAMFIFDLDALVAGFGRTVGAKQC